MLHYVGQLKTYISKKYQIHIISRVITNVSTGATHILHLSKHCFTRLTNCLKHKCVYQLTFNNY